MEKLSVKSFKMLALLLCSLLCFGGCEKLASLPDYREGAFVAELVFITPTSRLCATAEVSSPSSAQALRDVKLSFTEPTALNGLIVTRYEEQVSLNFKNLCVEDAPIQDLLRGIDLLLCDGSLTILGKEEREGIRFISAELQNEKEGKSYALSLEPTTGYPKELRTDTEILQIKAFDKTSP